MAAVSLGLTLYFDCNFLRHDWVLFMSNIHLYQIYYSDATKAAWDSDYLELDNRRNERPDWREYWPIRNFLLQAELKTEENYYGFFSTKFKARTRLSKQQVLDYMALRPDADVHLFSPLWDLSALFQNVFEQGNFFHPTLTAVAQEFLKEIGWKVDLSRLITDSRNTVFCNFFVAKPAFWKEWLTLGEQLFTIAENPAHPLSQKLNTACVYGEQVVPVKVFIMERLATLILATQEKWRINTFNPFALSSSSTQFSPFHLEAVLSDALKIAYKNHGNEEYLQAFFHLRKSIDQRLALNNE